MLPTENKWKLNQAKNKGKRATTRTRMPIKPPGAASGIRNVCSEIIPSIVLLWFLAYFCFPLLHTNTLMKVQLGSREAFGCRVLSACRTSNGGGKMHVSLLLHFTCIFDSEFFSMTAALWLTVRHTHTHLCAATQNFTFAFNLNQQI